MKDIAIRIFGPLRVYGPGSTDLTPVGAKTQALVALLATGPDHRRSRAWLQDKLWSDRAPKQAAGSLRQALVELRRALGPSADVLKADRAAIALDATRAEIITAAEGPSGEQEFLQGIDVRDGEFEAWLREMRAHHAARAEAATASPAPERTSEPPHPAPAPIRMPPRRLTVAFVPGDEGAADQRLLETIFVDMAAHSMREIFELDLRTGLPFDRPGDIPPPGALLISVRGQRIDHDRLGLRVSIEEAGTLRSFWADRAEVGPPISLTGENTPCLGLVHRLVRALSDLVASGLIARDQRSRDAGLVMAATAFRRMFTMRHSELAAADALLSQATEVEPRGLYLAWRAQLAAIRYVERQCDDFEALRERCAEDAARAIEAEPLNSNVLAAVANAGLILENDTARSGSLARQAIAANRANPLAWWAWANATLYAGEAEIAYSAAIMAQTLAERSSLKFWADFQRSLTAAVSGRHQEALTYAASASALAPSFRPPLRYLLALYSAAGQDQAARKTANRLSALEPGFTPERLLDDPDYPASMIRRAELVTRDRMAAALD